MFLPNPILLVSAIIISCLIYKFLSKTSLIYSFKKRLRSLEDKCYVYQFYKVPKFNENMQENHLFRKVYSYLNSLPTLEDSDFVNLFSGSKSSEINLVIDENQSVVDKFLGAKLQWKIENYEKQGVIVKTLVLQIRKHDRRRILGPYLQHIHQVYDEMELKKKDVRLFINMDSDVLKNGRWRSVPFRHPATMETMVMDLDLKNRIKSDLESFLKSKQYYHRLGRVWKRSYLLYGSAGTGKSTFIAAMAKFLGYDVYEINLNKVASDTDLQYLLLQTTNKSLIVVEDLDRYIQEKSRNVSLSAIRNFMDGVFSCCGEERVMVFTVNSKENIGASFLRPGRIDVHINFPLCDFTAFKSLASSHLGLKDHKLFPQVEEIFQTGASLSPAEICELMISNRSSPSRAVKTVITALQGNLVGRLGRRSSWSGSGKVIDDSSDSGMGLKEQGGIHPIKEIKNFYGFLRAKSSRKISVDFDVNEKDSDSSHGN